MFSPSYAWHELRRRFGRTLVTALGLAAGVGLVMSIIGVSDGLSAAQNSVLSPLGSVGTNVIVTRTVAATTNKNASSSTTNSSVPTRRGGGAGFFGQGFAGTSAATLNSAANATLLENNSSVLTDLAKLGPAGTKFTHDFFLPGTLINFPDQAAGIISKIKDVSTVTGALSLDAIHETGTVPTITATYKTGGQTLKVTSKPPTLTAAQQTAERACIQKLFASSAATRPSTFSSRPAGSTGRPAGGGGIRFIGTNSTFSKCLTPSQKAYEQNVVVPEETIRQTLNPPTTNTQTASYTVAGVSPSASTGGLITKAQVTKGTWFTGNTTDEVLVNTAYATQKGLHAGGTLTINKKAYKIVGLVNPTLTGDVADVYFNLSTAQSLASAPKEINEVLVSVKNASDVNAVTAAIKKALPGATVLTSKSLADSVSGSLSNAKKLADTLGGALAIVVLLAAFLIAALLTLSSVAKRVARDRDSSGDRLVARRRRTPDRRRDDRNRCRRRGDRNRPWRRHRGGDHSRRTGALRDDLGTCGRRLATLFGDRPVDERVGAQHRPPHRADPRHNGAARIGGCNRRRCACRYRRRMARLAARTSGGAQGPRLGERR